MTKEKVDYTIEVQEGKTFFNEGDEQEILENFARSILSQQKDLDPEFQKIMDEHFWDLVL